MPLPTGTTRLKIHPAIGFARLSTNSDSYEFGPIPQPSYKSNDRIKRQAVRFRIFAYDDNGRGIAELTPEKLAELNLRAVWHARVANRKIARVRNDDSYVISAVARSDANGGQLTGRCGDFTEGQIIKLGEIRPDGVFMPPVATVHAHQTGTPMQSGGIFHPDFTDNTCDGIISVQLIDQATSTPLPVPSLDAWIVVAPQDFAPEWNDVGEASLMTYLMELLALPNNPPVNAINRRAREIDRSVLESGTAVFSPGIEVSLRGVPNEMFYAGGATGDADEVRVRPGSSAGGPGTLPGELTAGLCSPWQFDFLACTCNYWPNTRPDVAFRDDLSGPEFRWLRRHLDDAGRNPSAGMLNTREEIVRHVDELGMIRKRAGKRAETERTKDFPPDVA